MNATQKDLEKLAERLSQTEPVVLHLQPPAAAALVATLQLALRHPANRGATSITMRHLCNDLIAYLSGGDKEAESLFRRGEDAAFDEPRDDVEDRAKRLARQVMRTWNPPREVGDVGHERVADCVQTAVMQTIAFVVGRHILPDLDPNQQAEIDEGLAVFERELRG